MTELLKVTDLEVSTHDGRTLASGLGFSISPGECLVFEGPNGSGKTTVLRTALGLHLYRRGRIDRHVKADSISFLPQMGNISFLLPLTLSDVLCFGKDNEKPLDDALALGLLGPDDLRRGWNTASGGERQKTLITRALISKPRLLVLDEPFNHLDGDSKRACLLLFQRYLSGEFGEPGALILVAHDTQLEGLKVKGTVYLGGPKP